MANINPKIPIITLNVSSLNTLIKNRDGKVKFAKNKTKQNNTATNMTQMSTRN